jgi:hemerythrin-like domain-containing protein
MTRTNKFRKQHDEILSTAREINGILGNAIDDNEAETIRKLMSRLAGLVSVHLAMEDKALYPQLLSSTNSAVKATANKFIQEMGAIGQSFEGYIRKWATTQAIKSKPAEFTIESKAIFNALSKRIHKENVELYMLVDEM